MLTIACKITEGSSSRDRSNADTRITMRQTTARRQEIKVQSEYGDCADGIHDRDHGGENATDLARQAAYALLTSMMLGEITPLLAVPRS